MVRGGEVTVLATNVDMEKPKIFEGDTAKVMGFVSMCKIYIKNKIGGAMLEEKIWWIFSLIQEGTVDV